MSALTGKSSRIQGFHKLTQEERLRIVREFSNLSDEEVELLRKWGSMDSKVAETMIENAISAMSYAYAIAPNFRINGREHLIPMVIEEPSVVAAASNAARLMREGEGIRSISTEPIMIGQIHLINVSNPEHKAVILLERKKEILDLANSADQVLTSLGGGAKDIEVRVLETEKGKVLTVHLLVDVRDAMGANAVNTMAERVSPLLEDLTGGRAVLRILSNLADKRLVRVRGYIRAEEIGGREVVERIEWASSIAFADPYRAATHNKGIMNGVIAVALATGQDHRAIEAGAHAYASRTGKYLPLSRWEATPEGDLVGVLEMPLAVGTVGGTVRVHPMARLSLKILGVNSSRELAEIMGAVGLAQNLAALKALVTEGIQRGHMRLHAKSLAVMAGATYEEAEKIAEILEKEGNITYKRAKELLDSLRAGGSGKS
ncbi:MAG: hydroxymethylglutaryl-CoA reductase, degradative [Fervidicoccaceae archaeon]